MTTQAEQKKSPAARVTIVHQRAIFALLEDHFDTEKEEYAEGWSDLKIAQEVGCTPAAVVYRREGAFGKLKKLPTKLTLPDLRDAVDIVVERLTWIEEDCQKNFMEMNERQEKTVGLLNKLVHSLGDHTDKLETLGNQVALHEATLIQGGTDVIDLAKNITDIGGVQKIMHDTLGVLTDEIALPGTDTCASVIQALVTEVTELKAQMVTLGDQGIAV